MYLGVKEFISQYKEPFDREAKATKKAKANLKDRGEKATGEALIEEIDLVLAEWDEKTQLGENAHVTIHEREIKKIPNAIYKQYVKHEESDGEMDAQLESNLIRGNTYFEKKIVSNHHHLIGRADKVEVTKDGFINIEDYKTFDTLYRTGSFTLENGFKVQSKYFFPPINHIEDCNYNQACLQLSIYMYILWTYNKRLKPGKLFIRHVKLTDDGNIIHEELLEVPFLRDEVKALLKNKKLING